MGIEPNGTRDCGTRATIALCHRCHSTLAGHCASPFHKNYILSQVIVAMAPRQNPTSNPSEEQSTTNSSPTAPHAEAPPSQPRTRTWARVMLGLVLGYLLVQLALPMSPILFHPSQVRTDFSWDMFAVRRDCEVCQLVAGWEGAAPQKLGWGFLYRSPYHVARTRNKLRLPQAAREACRRLKAQGRKNPQVFVECRCRYNQEDELYNLDSFGGDYCSAKAAALYD